MGILKLFSNHPCVVHRIVSGARAVLRGVFAAAALIPYGGLYGDEPPPECAVAVDVGYSFCHVLPLRDGQILWDHVKRCVCHDSQSKGR